MTYGELFKRYCKPNVPKELARCRVSFTHQDGILHAVDVDADSLYEAAAHAVAEFRAACSIKATPSPTTEFTVSLSETCRASHSAHSSGEVGGAHNEKRTCLNNETRTGQETARTDILATNSVGSTTNTPCNYPANEPVRCLRELRSSRSIFQTSS
jgi:hypothetical protein